MQPIIVRSMDRPVSLMNSDRSGQSCSVAVYIILALIIARVYIARALSLNNI